ncbi:MAG TPA: FG-GAP-like repeat-containing protein, partial [bacterium]
DGDGDWDLFVGREINYSNPTNGDVFFYENTGTPTVYNFQFITPNYLTLDVGYTARLQLVDIDADNDLDLFICAGNVMRFFPNIGTPSAPSFLWESDAYEGIAVQDMVPSFADLDADGDFDLLAGSGAIPGPPGIYLFQNRGTPQQAQFVLYSSNFVPANYFVMVAPTLADIDADGDLDLILTDQDNTGTLDIWYFQNNGSAQWPDFQLVTQNWQGIYIYSGLQRYLQFYDIDQDGDLDLFFFNNWDEPGGLNLRFYENQGTPQNASMVLNTSSYLPSAVIMACPWFCDIDADDHTDLFVGDSDGGVLFFHGLDDTSGWVLPPVQRHPLAGLELALGPNPANPLTVIRCQLPVASNISLEVFDISGRKLVELASGFHLPGEYRYVWDAGNRAAGMYVVRLKTGRETVGKKLVILK